MLKLLVNHAILQQSSAIHVLKSSYGLCFLQDRTFSRSTAVCGFNPVRTSTLAPSSPQVHHQHLAAASNGNITCNVEQLNKSGSWAWFGFAAAGVAAMLAAGITPRAAADASKDQVGTCTTTSCRHLSLLIVSTSACMRACIYTILCTTMVC
jgi:hypothetical protein